MKTETPITDAAVNSGQIQCDICADEMRRLERAANKLADATEKLMTANLYEEESAEKEADVAWTAYNQMRLAAGSNNEAQR